MFSGCPAHSRYLVDELLIIVGGRGLAVSALLCLKFDWKLVTEHIGPSVIGDV